MRNFANFQMMAEEKLNASDFAFGCPWDDYDVGALPFSSIER